jgi:hypothetical protein
MLKIVQTILDNFAKVRKKMIELINLTVKTL